MEDKVVGNKWEKIRLKKEWKIFRKEKKTEKIVDNEKKWVKKREMEFQPLGYEKKMTGKNTLFINNEIEKSALHSELRMRDQCDAFR